jgi:hypothetical protein
MVLFLDDFNVNETTGIGNDTFVVVEIAWCTSYCKYLRIAVDEWKTHKPVASTLPPTINANAKAFR